MKLAALFFILCSYAVAAEECRVFSRPVSPRLTGQQFADQCRQQLPQGHVVEQVGRRVANAELMHFCRTCPKDRVQTPRPKPAADRCHRFSRTVNSVNGVQFRDQCLQRLPSGYHIERIHTATENAEFVRVCRMCPQHKARSPAINSDGRDLPRGEAAGSGASTRSQQGATQE